MTAVVVRLHHKKKPRLINKPKRRTPLKYRDPDLDELLPLIERYMKKQKLSVQKLASASDSSNSMVYNWLNRITRHPSHVKMANMARAIGMEYRLVDRE